MLYMELPGTKHRDMEIISKKRKEAKTEIAPLILMQLFQIIITLTTKNTEL